jgi:hypothetical protein
MLSAETAQLKTLHLTLKKQWFDMIASGEKKEEYRELKPYWGQRLTSHWCKAESKKCIPPFKNYHLVEFTNGYGKDKPRLTLVLHSIRIGSGKPEWGGDPGGNQFVIRLGSEISRENFN